MNKQTKKMLGIGFIGLTALSAGTVAVTAFGDEDGFGNGHIGQSDEIKQAIDANDYDLFAQLTDRDISEDQFDMIVARSQIHEAVEDAIENEDYEAFVQALDDVDREIPSEEQFNDMVQRHQAHEKVEQAIEQGSYDLWVSAIQDLPHAQDMADLISEDEFDIMVDMHEAREDGDYETAKELADELGLDQQQKRGQGEGRGEGRNSFNNNGSGSQKGMRGLSR